MNIFYLDADPTRCAEMYCNSHVVKMLLETAQMLCSVHHMTGTEERIPYRKTHANHPCCIWARSSIQHYLWLVNLGEALSLEYTHRYKKVHKSSHIIRWAAKRLPENLADNNFVEPPQCMPDEFKVPGSTIESYKKYYKHKLENPRMMAYTNRNVPEFIGGSK